MTVNRRSLIAAGMGLSASATVAVARSAPPAKDSKDFLSDLEAASERDQTALLQSAIDAAAQRGEAVRLPPGTFRISDLRLSAGSRLFGANGATTLLFTGGPAFITADMADAIVLDGLILDGAYKATDEARGEGLVTITRAKALDIRDCEIRHSARSGLALVDVAGRVSRLTIHHVLEAGIKSLDAAGLEISGNTISDCSNNGILVWRTQPGEDATIVTGNRISNIRNRRGGTGQYGNGINVFRAGSVLVANNRISDCTYSAIRGNAASNIQIVANSCERLGEVAIYSEFSFEGALIANNIIDAAATGISAVNYNDGGRLAVIQGNLIRNLFRREQEHTDKRGDGIQVEADAAVSGNIIEGAPTAGIKIGWGPFMRDVAATGNVIRTSGVGVLITSDPAAGHCLIANNLISGARDGAIRTAAYGDVMGPDLAREPAIAGRIVVTGNTAA